MDKTVLILILLFFSQTIFSQTIEELIDEVSMQYNKKEYKLALNNLEHAQNQIEELLVSDMLNQVLSSKILEFEEIISNNFAEKNGCTTKISKAYSKHLKNKAANTELELEIAEPQIISISISNDINHYCETIKKHHLLSCSKNDSKSSAKPKLNSFEGFYAYYQVNEDGFGNFTILIGNAVLEIEGNGFSNEEELIAIYQALSLKIIVKAFEN